MVVSTRRGLESKTERARYPARDEAQSTTPLPSTGFTSECLAPDPILTLSVKRVQPCSAPFRRRLTAVKQKLAALPAPGAPRIAPRHGAVSVCDLGGRWSRAADAAGRAGP